MPSRQKKASDLIVDVCEPPCGCWKFNSGPLGEQTGLLTSSEPSLTFPNHVFITVENSIVKTLEFTANSLDCEPRCLRQHWLVWCGGRVECTSDSEPKL